MAEKGGDGGQDNVSLPPTYAPSEAYTESPPPAYRGARQNSKVVQIVRLICVTAVVLALLTGFFVLSTHYLKARSCSCEPRSLDSEEGRTALLQAGFLHPILPPNAQPLVKEKEEEAKVNTLDAGDDTVLGDEGMLKEKQQQQQEKQQKKQEEEEQQLKAVLEEVAKEVEEEEEKLEEELRREEEDEEEALQDILQAQAEHMKKIRLPIDLILGNNPALAGREVNCEVERRQIPVAPGIVSQTIFVTCRDTDDDPRDAANGQPGGDGPFPLPPLSQLTPPRPLRPRQGPPMSLLAPIMKMLTSRPGPQPRLVPISVRGPMPFIPQGRSSPRVPFPFPMSKPRMTPVVILPRPGPQEGPSDRMLPRHLQPMVRLAPRVISLPRPDPSNQGPVSLMGLQRGAMPLPQARPRAPPHPVSLSSPPFPQRPIPAAFLPFNAISEPQTRPQPRPATHMEMIAPRQEPQDPTPPRMDFGPPRGHTLINGAPQDSPQAPPRSPPRLITLPKAIRIHTLPRESLTPPSPHFPPQFPPQFSPQFPPQFPPQDDNQPPQPPRFAPEPLRSPNPPELNHEAEVISAPQSQGPPQGDIPSSPAPHRKHHLLMVN